MRSRPGNPQLALQLTPMVSFALSLIRRFSHVNWALADQTLVSGVNFLTGILLARYLGIEEFGRFTLAWLVVLFAASIQHAAINSPMMSIGPKQPEADAPAYYGAVMIQQVVFGILAFALVWAGVTLGAVLFPEWRVAGLALPLACAAIAYQFQDFLRRYFFTRGRGKMAFTNDAVCYLGQLLVLIWLFQTTAMDSARTIWVIAGTAAMAALYGVFLVEKLAWSPGALRGTASRHWNFGKWLTASALMHWISANLFVFAAGALLGASAVGALKAAQNLMGVTHILFLGLENVVPIRAAWHYQHGGKRALTTYLRHFALLGGLVTATVALVASAAPEFWLGLVYGDAYVSYGHLLRWYAALYLTIFLGFPLVAGVKTLENTRPLFTASVARTLFTIASAYALVSGLGLTGVMIGILIGQVIACVVLFRALALSLTSTHQ